MDPALAQPDGVKERSKETPLLVALQEVVGVRPLSKGKTREEVLSRVEELVKSGADVNAKDIIGGATALHLCFAAPCISLSSFVPWKIFVMIVDAGAEVNAQNNRGQSAAHSAASSHVIEKLIDLESTAPLNQGDFPTRPSNILEALIEAKGNVNARDFDGCTPLHCASQQGHHRIVNFLLENGAEVNIDERSPCQTALGFACRQFCNKAENKQYLTVVKLLLEHGANVNAGNPNPLAIATIFGFEKHIELVELLVSQRADVNLRIDSNEVTPLLGFAAKGWVSGVKCMIESGALLDEKDVKGYTAILRASQTSCDALKALIQAGADLYARNEEGKTALELAARRGKMDCVVELVRAGMDGRNVLKWLRSVDSSSKTANALFIGETRTAFTVIQDVQDALDQRTMAVWMGAHARLGHESPLSLLDGGLFTVIFDQLQKSEEEAYCHSDWEVSQGGSEWGESEEEFTDEGEFDEFNGDGDWDFDDEMVQENENNWPAAPPEGYVPQSRRLHYEEYTDEDEHDEFDGEYDDDISYEHSAVEDDWPAAS